MKLEKLAGGLQSKYVMCMYIDIDNICIERGLSRFTKKYAHFRPMIGSKDSGWGRQ